MRQIPPLSTLAVAAAVLAASPALAQLSPPTGAVAPTQATEIFSIPFTISQPGSYRLARDLTATAAGAMISVAAADVTIDLGGHTLNGGGVATSGIVIVTGGDRLHIRNGHLTGTTDRLIGANFRAITVENVTLSNSANGNGIAAANGEPCIIRNVTVHTVGFNGVAASEGSILENVTVIDAASNGFDSNGRTTFRGCTAVSCGVNGFIIGGGGGATMEGCVADSNTGSGFVVGPGSVLRGCKAHDNGAPRAREAQPAAPAPGGPSADSAGGAVAHPFDGYVNPAIIDPRTGRQVPGLVNLPLIERPRGLTSGADGIRAGAGCHIESCAANNNADDGIAAGDGSTVVACTARANTAAGISVGVDSAVGDCTASGNTGPGIVAGQRCRLTGCAASSNTGGGITADDRSTLERCIASANAASGVTADSTCRLSECRADGNAGATSDGFTVNGADPTVTGCAASSNGQHGIHITVGSGADVRNCYGSTNSGNAIHLAGTFALVVHNHVEIDDIIDAGSSNRVGPIFTGADLTTAPAWANFDF